MKPELIILDSPKDVPALIEYITQFEYITFDTETTGLSKRDKVIGLSVCGEETKAYYVIIAKWSEGGLTPIPGMFDAVTGLLERLKGKSLIMHNSVFDCKMIASNFKISLIEYVHTDTLILAQLLNENRKNGLKELAKEFFGQSSTKEQEEMKASVEANGGKLTKKCYEMYKCDPYIMGKYGAKDALLTLQVFYVLVLQLYEQGLDKFFYEEESMPLLREATYQLNTVGLAVDMKEVYRLKAELQIDCAQAKEFVLNETKALVAEKYPGTNKKNQFNLGATQQLAWLLYGKLGLPFDSLTDGGKELAKELGIKTYTAVGKRDFIHTVTQNKGQAYLGKKKIRDPWAYIQCSKKSLKEHSKRYQWVAKLLEYQRKTKILNTYVSALETKTEYGIIQPSFLQAGTTSGRYASRDPNFQNLPKDDISIKKCIIPRPGKVFVGADQSQLEPRVFSYLSQDKNLMESFNGTNDFYSVIGMKVYGKYDCTPHKEGSPDAFGIKYKKLRDLSKVIALATVYGASAYRLSHVTNKSVDDTQDDINAYLEEFPGVKQFMLDSHSQVKNNGEVKSLFGRPRRIPDAKKIPRIYGQTNHDDLPNDVKSMLNLATNHRVQSTGASIVNRSMIKLLKKSKEMKLDLKLVLQVHDSLVVEVAKDQAGIATELLKNCMETTTELPGVPLEAIPKVGMTLAEV